MRRVPIHLRAERGDYAAAVLCPGDPRRATYIAERFFADAKLVNEERGMLGYTGSFEGSPISVQSTGMGCPSAGIVYEELIQLGAIRLLRVGTCGAIGTGMAMADLVIGVTASAVDTTALQYAGMDGYAPAATFALAETAARLGREGKGARAHGPDRDVGPVLRPRPAEHCALEAHRPPGHRDGGGDALHGRCGARGGGTGDDDGERPGDRVGVDAHLRRRAASAASTT